MKKTLKIFVLVFTLALVMALGVVAASAATATTVMNPEDNPTVVLQPKDTLTYTDKGGKTWVIENTFGVEIAAHYYADADRYALGTLTITTNDATKTYDGNGFTAEELNNGRWTKAPAPYVAPDGNYHVALTQNADVFDYKDAGNYANKVDYEIKFIKPGQEVKNVPADYFILDAQYGTLTINEAEMDVVDDGFTGDYDAEEHGYEVTADTVNPLVNPYTVTYRDTVDGEYVATAPKFTNAGTYTVYYKVTAPNHKEATGSFEVTIAKKNIADAEITLGAGLTYTGAEQTQTIFSVVVDGLTVTFEVAGNTGTNAGDDYVLTVTGNGNFAGEATKAWSIAKAQAEITVDDAPIVKTYGEVWTLPEATSTFGTPVANYTVEAMKNADVYTLVFTVEATDNYYGDAVEIAVTVKKAAAPTGVTVAQKGTHTYNGYAQTIEAVVGAFPEAPLTQEGLTCEYTDAGTYTVTYKATFANYEDFVTEWTAEIKKAVITVKANDVTIIYGDAASNHGYSTTVEGRNDGALFNEDVLTGAVVYDYGGYAIGSPAREYAITLSGLNATKNYEIRYEPGTLKVEKKVMTVTVLKGDNVTFIYDGMPHSYALTILGSIAGLLPDDFGGVDTSAKATTITATNAGEYTIDLKHYAVNASGEDRTESYTLEYAFVDAEGNELPEGTEMPKLVITPAQITITANNNSITYGDAPAGNGYYAEGMPAAGVAITGTPIWGFVDAEGNEYVQYGNVGTYTIKISGLDVDNENYTIEYKTGTLTVDPKKINVTIVDKTVTYGELIIPDEDFTYTTDGEFEGYPIVPVWDTWYYQGAPVGDDYYIKATNSNPNYEVTFTEGTVTVKKRVVKVTISNNTAIYGMPYDPFGVVTENLFALDDYDDLGVLLETEYDIGDGVGTYVVTATISNGNYELKLVPGSIKVNPRPVTVTVDSQTIRYGEVYASITGKVTDGSIYENDNLDDLNMTYYSVLYTPGSAVGTYVLNGGAMNDNYDVTVVPGTLTVNPRPVTVTVADATTAYKTDAPDYTYVSIEGLYSGDSEDVLNLDYLCGYANGDAATTYPISAKIDNGNYALSVVPGTLTVTKNAKEDADIYVEFAEVVYNNAFYNPAAFVVPGSFTVEGEAGEWKIVSITKDGVIYYDETHLAWPAMNAGTYTVTFEITSGNYEGSTGTEDFVVQKKTVDFVNWDPVLNNQYTGSAWAPEAYNIINVGGDKRVKIVYETTTGTVVGEYNGLVLGIKEVYVYNEGTNEFELDASMKENFKINATTMGEVKFKITPSIDYPINSASLTIDKTYAINFKVHVDALKQYGGSYTFTVDGIELTASAPDAYGYLYFTYEGINPAHMATVFEATLTINGQNVVKTESKTYSVAEYCYNRLDALASIANGDLANLKDGNAEFAKVLVALLRYGAEAQATVGATTTPVTDKLETEKAYEIFNAITTAGTYTALDTDHKVDETVATKIGATVVMNNGVALRFVVQAADLTGCKYYINGVDETANVTVTALTGGYMIDYAIALYDCDTKYTFEVKTADDKQVATITYSAETYAVNKDNALVKALVDFSNALKAYV